MTRSRTCSRWSFVLVLLMLGSGVGCTSRDGSDQAKPSVSSVRTVQRTSFDPPKVFNPAPAAQLPRMDPPPSQRSCVLGDGVLFCATGNGLQAFDSASARVIWSMRPTVSPRAEGFSAPTFWSSAAPKVRGTTVFTLFGGMLPGTGTGRDRYAWQLSASDAKTGAQQWQTTVDLGADFGRYPLEIISVTDTSVVIGAAPALPDPPYPTPARAKAWVVDRDTHQVRWHRDGFYPGHAAEGEVVGLVASGGPETQTLLGLSITDGNEQWRRVSGSNTRFATSNVPGFAIVASERGGLDVVVPKSGAVAYHQPKTGGLECQFDDEVTVVCQSRAGGDILTFDITAPAQPRWALEQSATREPPKITAVYHGLIYGENARGQGVSLDATSGEDAPTQPGIVPIMVDRYIGIADGAVHLPLE